MDYDYFIDRFEKRAKKKRLQSYFFLSVSVILLVVLFLFLHSGMSNYKDLKTHIETYESWTGRLVYHNNNLENARNNLTGQLPTAKLDSAQNAYLTMLDSLTDVSKLYADSIASMSRSIISAAKKDSDNTSLLVDTSARVLLAIIGFFLIQIFLKLYRYNMETADFYTSLADSIAILKLENASIHAISFETLTKILNPSQIRLDIPNTPSIADATSFLKGGA